MQPEYKFSVFISMKSGREYEHDVMCDPIAGTDTTGPEFVKALLNGRDKFRSIFETAKTDGSSAVMHFNDFQYDVAEMVRFRILVLGNTGYDNAWEVVEHD